MSEQPEPAAAPRSGDVATTDDATELDAESNSREDDLQRGLDDLSRLMLGSLDLQPALAHVAAAAKAAIPHADGVGVTLLRADQPVQRVQTVAASHPFVQEIDTIQYEVVQEGPCITAALQRAPVLCPSLAADTRWPRFTVRVGRLGIRSVLALPLTLPNDTVVGALNAYSRTTDAFDDDAMRLGELFALPAGVAVHNLQLLALAQQQAEQFRTALTSRATIDQAIGILRSRSGGTEGDAFATLREMSQRENTKLSLIAQRVVNEAVRRAQARRAGS